MHKVHTDSQTPPRAPHAARRRRGAVTILGAIVAFFLIALLGLAIDTAWVQTARQQLQRTADAAALAGVAQIRSSEAPVYATARDAAVRIAAANPVVGCCPQGVVLDPNPSNDPGGDVVLGRWRLDTGTGAFVFDPTDPSPDAVQVRARSGTGSQNASLPLLFGSLFGQDTAEGGRPAIARLGTPDNPLIVVLDPNRPGSLSIGGSVGLDVSAGTVQVNSNNTCAVTSNGAAAHIYTTRLRVVGGSCADGGTVVGDVVSGSTVVPDPLAALTEPSSLGLPVLGPITGGGTYAPGYYPGGIDMNNGTAVLQPGTFIIGSQAPGNGITMRGNSFVDATSGVTIFLQNGGSYQASGTSRVRITAPSSGTYQGIGFFQSRGNVAAFSANGNVDFDVQGTVYIPSAQVNLGGLAGRNFGRLIAGALDLSGNTAITIDGSLVPPTGSPAPFLVQ